jgi:hypothetical protein
MTYVVHEEYLAPNPLGPGADAGGGIPRGYFLLSREKYYEDHSAAIRSAKRRVRNPKTERVTITLVPNRSDQPSQTLWAWERKRTSPIGRE